MKKLLLIAAIIVSVMSCQNRDINEGEEFRPRAVNDSFEDQHFTKVTVDGVEYIMTERDNNNPHEGFGFMAFRANTMLEKQDTLISYLKTLQFFQNKVYSRIYGISLDSGQAEFDAKLLEFFALETKELEELEREDLTNTSSGSQEEE